MASLLDGEPRGAAGDRPPSNAEHVNGWPSVAIPPAVLTSFAEQVAELVAEKLPQRVEPYLGVEDAAAYLACPSSRVYDLVAQRRLAHFRDGRRLLFRRDDLDAALARRSAE